MDDLVEKENLMKKPKGMSTRDWRRIALGLFAAVSGLAALRWAVLILVARQASAKFDMGIIEGLELDTVEFQESFKESLSELLSLPRVIYVSGDGLWVVALAAAATIFLWWKSDVRSAGRNWRIALGFMAFLPAVAGLGWVPVTMRRSFAALAEAGLSAPQAVGSGVGEAFSSFVLGLEASLLLAACGLLALRFGAKPGEAVGNPSSADEGRVDT